ncbi:MAG: Lyzozyme M1 (1,4-beta-N-acetylmuramidase), partial [Lachnospiraceae bacterium]|nr:Lyzozyme M1 (1,4-beta-N-acetylmuramidase) [Lachnospiraceae bacterium]
KFDSSRTESMNGAERTDTVLAFCRTVEEAGYSSALYANSKWLTTELDIRRLTDVDIWYADYQIYDNDEAPLYPYPFTIWQYTNKGKVDGISGDVDINIAFKRQN